MSGRPLVSHSLMSSAREIRDLNNKIFNMSVRPGTVTSQRNYNFSRSQPDQGKLNNRDAFQSYQKIHHRNMCASAYTPRFLENWNVLKPRNPSLEKELFDSSKVSAGINFDNYDKIPVTLSDPSIKPMEGVCEDLDLPEFLLENIKLLQYKKLTPVQKYTIPIVHEGRDIIGCAQTGSGKTAAFLMPMLLKIHQEGRYDVEREVHLCQPKALVIVPTRELATQIFNEAKKLTYRSCIIPSMVYGGVPAHTQISFWRMNVSHLVVGTPGRIVDMIQRRTLELSKCKYVVFDEADRMLDMGFAPQIEAIVYESKLPPKGQRQTLMFSATFPKEVKQIADDYLLNPVRLEVGVVGAASQNITQNIVWVEEPNKFSELVKLISDVKDLLLVFVEQKMTVDIIENSLARIGIKVVGIHGDRTQEEREMALESFRSGRCKVMVATSVAARGLDIPNIQHVINYDFPTNFDDYVHRIGRTGRAGNLGQATSFFNRENERHAGSLAKLLEDNTQEVPQWLERMKVFGSSVNSRSSGNSYKSSNRHDFSRNGRDNSRFENNNKFNNRNSRSGTFQNGPAQSDNRFVGGNRNGSKHSSSKPQSQQEDSWW